MGIIRIILISIFLILSNALLAFNDTITVDNSKYIKYEVKVGDSMNSIANFFGISIDKIIKSNETGFELYLNQVLFIPIKSSSNISAQDNIFKSNKEFDIALLLPFYKNLNDTMVASFEDKKEADKIILNKSQMALQFMQGVLLSLDSLNKLGVKINLIVHDTRNDSLQIEEIVKSKSLDTVDVIIGPIYSKNLQIISNYYGKDNDKIIISPLSRSIDFLKNNKSI